MIIRAHSDTNFSNMIEDFNSRDPDVIISADYATLQLTVDEVRLYTAHLDDELVFYGAEEV
jgi:5'-3' exonuclease